MQQGTALLSNKILFSTGTRPIFNINNSKFQRVEPLLVISSKTYYFNPLHDASASGARIEIPSCQHPEVLNKEGVGEASREEEAQNRQDLKHDENQRRGAENELLSETEMEQVASLEEQELARDSELAGMVEFF